ncbi:MAG: DNA repair protein RecO [Ignavibacteriaceae bacterium]
MSEIIKTEAVVLSKLNYGDTSYIISLYSKELGKISAIVKGARSPKSKLGLVTDPVNHLQVVLYKKDTRELQIISSADLLSNFTELKSDFDKLKYSQAIIELVKKLTVEHETNPRLFKGIIRILELLNSSDEAPNILFSRFFLFFLEELGYGITLEKCSVCGKSIQPEAGLSYNFGIGILCHVCRKEKAESYIFTLELFNYLYCLKGRKKIEVNGKFADKAISFMENYLKYHVPDFKGIQSLQIYN